MPGAAPDPAYDYVSEVDYPITFAPNQAPAHLNYICALNGVAGPGRDGAFRFCELGCGAGKSVAVLAAAYPEAEFLGIDLNARQIDQGRSLAEAGGVANASFLAADIAELDLDSLPDFDFITMEGLYTWVPAEVRAAVVRLIAAKLRPGGVVHVTYNTYPGWGGITQVRQYFLDRARSLEGSATEVVQKVLEEIAKLRELGAPFFTENLGATSLLEKVSKQDPRYIVHEFFAPNWGPLTFAEVNRQMESAGLAYVGDSRVVHNFLEHAVPEALVETTRAMGDRLAQERTKDLIINRFYRSDVYVRPRDGEEVPGAAAEALVAGTVFGMTKTPGELSNTVEIPLGKIELAGTSVERLKILLASESLSLAEILAHPDLSECPREELIQSVRLFSFDRQIIPFAKRTKVPSTPAPARLRCPLGLNRVLLAEPTGSEVVLASPAAGTGIMILPLEACLLLGLTSEDPAGTALAEIQRRGLNLTQGGQHLQSEADLRAAVERLLPQYSAGKVPKLAALGVIEPW